MKIASLNTSLSRLNGGVSEVSRRLAQELEVLDLGSMSVFGIFDDPLREDLAAWSPLLPRAFVPAFPKAYGYSPQYLGELLELAPDLCHVHGIWSYPGLAARRWSAKSGCPYLVTLHGMLTPWALQHSRWKKAILAGLVERANLRHGACLHAITSAEVEAFREYGLDNAICLIPNGVDLPAPDAPPVPPPWTPIESGGKKVLLYLGRIHSKKGLLPLVDAWKLLRERNAPLRREWTLMIAGWDQEGHESLLRARVAAAGLEGDVHFVGPQFGAAKAAAYRHAAAFVLPSFSEGLPLVVLEAWAHQLPCLITAECNLPEGFSARAALAISPNPESIAEGVEALAALSSSAREAMGRAGYDLVRERFSWPTVARQMRAVYRWLKGGERPSGIITR